MSITWQEKWRSKSILGKFSYKMALYWYIGTGAIGGSSSMEGKYWSLQTGSIIMKNELSSADIHSQMLSSSTWFNSLLVELVCDAIPTPYSLLPSMSLFVRALTMSLLHSLGSHHLNNLLWYLMAFKKTTCQCSDNKFVKKKSYIVCYATHSYNFV